MDKLKVGEFTDLFYPTLNGVTKVVDKLSNALGETDCAEVRVSATRGKKGRLPEPPEDRAYELVTCRGFTVPIQKDTTSLPGLDRKYRKEIASKPLDILHCHTMGGQFKMAKKLKKEWDVPIVATLHAQADLDLKKFLKAQWLVNKIMHGMMKSYNSCDEIWSLNTGMRDYAVKWGADPSKIRVVGNACDYRYPENPKKICEEFDREHGIGADETVFLFVGRLLDYKNIFFTLDALKILKERGLKFRMYYVGEGPDGGRLKRAVAEYGMEDCVSLEGKVIDRKKLAAYYLRAKLFLFPSLFDAFSIVQLEAAAHKTPTLFLKGSVTSSGFVDGQNMFESGHSPEAFADRVEEILKNSELYERVSEGCYREMYRSWEDYARNVADAYADAIARYRARAEVRKGTPFRIPKKHLYVRQNCSFFAVS